jgi:hypothetical protein
MKKALFPFMMAVLLTASCHNQQPAQENSSDNTPMLHRQLPGDSARYGLACDGSTDSVLVFLPYSADRLDTFDIINAHQQHRIYGRPRIGDEVAVIINPEDTVEALAVINVGKLRGTWCYMVNPTFRNVESMPKRIQRRMLENIPDSLRQLWLTPREYTLRLKTDQTATAYGGMRRQTTTDDMSPVEFPAVRRYTEWHLYNGRLILKADTIAGFTQEGEQPYTDTVSIRLLLEDSLILQFPDHEQSYYRKQNQE